MKITSISCEIVVVFFDEDFVQEEKRYGYVKPEKAYNFDLTYFKALLLNLQFGH